MKEKRVVVVTGVSGYWGKRVALRLAVEADLHLIGLDLKPPEETIAGLDFIEAEPGNPALAELFREETVDTLCHLDFIEAIQPNSDAFNHNVVGTIKLLGACARAGVRKIVWKSSTAVYGAHPANDAFLTEDYPLAGSRHYGYTRDLIEIETFCQNFSRQAPDIVLTVLRFAGIVGPTVDSPLTRFLSNRRAPLLLGFDPMMQLIHEEDVVAAIVHVVLNYYNDYPGAFNVAAEEALPLLRLTTLAGKLPIPIFHPLAYAGVRRWGRERSAPIELDYVLYPWVGDRAKMRDVLNFSPQYTAEEALGAFVKRQHTPHNTLEPVAPTKSEDHLRQIIARRRQTKAQQDPPGSGDAISEERPRL